MSLATYTEARPWAKAIKEVVLARRMPKWPVVRGYGDFTNDPSLSSFEIALVAAWADGGAPQSGKPDSTPVAKATMAAQGDAAATRPVRSFTRECTETTLPAGVVVGLRPSLPKGGSLRLTMVRRDGEDPLLWIKDFEPEFAQTYWLRNPVTSNRFFRVVAEVSGPCSLTTLLADETGR